MAETYEDLKRRIYQNVPERYKSCTDPIGALQNTLVEMELVLKFLGWDVEDERYMDLAKAIMNTEPNRLCTLQIPWYHEQ